MDPRWEAIRIVSKPFAGAPRKSAPKSHDQRAWVSVMKASAEECMATMNEVWPLLESVHQAIQLGDHGGSVVLDRPAEAIAAILAKFDGHLPRLAEVRTIPGLRKLSEADYTRLRRLAHPIGGDLTPFFMILALHSGFNEQPLRSLTLGGITEHYPLGYKRTVIKSSKTRAGTSEKGTPQRAAFPASDHPLAPERLIEFIKAWTRRIRDYADEEFAEDLFLHVISEGGRNKRRGMHIDSYAARNDNVNTRITNYIMTFCEQRGLKYSGTRENRLAFAEIVDELTAGDAFELRAMLGHRSISTGQDSYQTINTQRKQSEQLAGAMMAQQRWIGSKGNVDTRSKRGHRDRTAATPGFACADPYQSPQPDQKEGKLCTSYGKCPACPLALADPSHGYALGRFLQLMELYEEAKLELGIEIWRRKYNASCVAIQEHWIPAVDSATSRQQTTTLLLSPLPALE